VIRAVAACSSVRRMMPSPGTRRRVGRQLRDGTSGSGGGPRWAGEAAWGNLRQGTSLARPRSGGCWAGHLDQKGHAARLPAHHWRVTILPAIGFSGSFAGALGPVMCITLVAEAQLVAGGHGYRVGRHGLRMSLPGHDWLNPAGPGSGESLRFRVPQPRSEPGIRAMTCG
jgi:hypothetical protein